jgi:hypothetical protein
VRDECMRKCVALVLVSRRLKLAALLQRDPVAVGVVPTCVGGLAGAVDWISRRTAQSRQWQRA